MTRPMTSAEKLRFKGYFPGLNVDAAVVSGEATGIYNCISWTVGVTDRWLWPGPTLQQFDTFYRQFGFARAGNGPLSAWGHSNSGMTHGSISGPGHGARWESKCGPDLRIQHGLSELEGSTYGRVLAFYARSLALAAPAVKILEAKKIMKPTTTGKDRTALKEIASGASAETKKAYQAAFIAWKRSWFEGGLAISSDPHSRTVGKEFDALVALGPAILPLVVESLTDPENFFALQIYDALQPDQKLIVQFEPDDERILAGEQGRAQEVVRQWIASHLVAA